VVRVIVTDAGDVEKAEVISGDPILAKAATDAAMQWKFKPLTQNGQPVKAATRISIDFELPATETDTSVKITTAADGTQRASAPKGVVQGWLIRGGVPDYPPIASSHQMDGVVVLQALIDKQGKIEDLKLISGPEIFVRSAMDAVWQWRYKPYMLNGEPIEVETQIIVNFEHSRPRP
jgi:TonB family protein